MPTASEPTESRASAPATVAGFVRDRLVWLLLATYALAAVVPAPGIWLQQLGVPDTDPGQPVSTAVRFSLVMVGVLLLCGALSVDVGKLRELIQRAGGLALALLGVAFPPVLVVAGWGIAATAWLTPTDATALAVGLALAGAMPVANSAVAWTHQSGGSLAWALGLVVLSICLCPWVAPGLLQVMGLTLSAADADQANLLVSRFTGAIFLVWVLGPTLIGLGIRTALGAATIRAARHVLTLVSAAALLLLNYANAATALPRVFAEPDWTLLGTTLIAAATLPIAGVAVARMLARLAGVSRHAALAWSYALGMKNTGLALGLAGATLGDRPIVVVTILAVTLTQHFVAGVVHAWQTKISDVAPER
ncbi:MAG: bile acid:sodium symporter [Planctomycetota bacterium]